MEKLKSLPVCCGGENSQNEAAKAVGSLSCEPEKGFSVTPLHSFTFVLTNNHWLLQI